MRFVILSLLICAPTFAEAQASRPCAPSMRTTGECEISAAKLAPPTAAEAATSEGQVPVQATVSVQIQPAGTVAGDPVTRHRIIPALVISGAVALGVGYVFSAVASMIIGGFGNSEQRDLANWGYVPVLGPFVQAFGSEGLLEWGLIDGLVQAAGLTLLIFGIIGHDEVETGYVENNGPRITGVAPVLAANTAGWALRGQF